MDQKQETAARINRKKQWSDDRKARLERREGSPTIRKHVVWFNLYRSPQGHLWVGGGFTNGSEAKRLGAAAKNYIRTERVEFNVHDRELSPGGKA